MGFLGDEMNDAQRLGRQIEEARNARGWSQKQLAAQLGRGGAERTIQSWEAGERMPRGKTLAKLRTLLDLEGTEEETRSEWSFRTRRVMNVLGDQLATLDSDDLRTWRHEFIVRLVQEGEPGRREGWPDDVEVIVDIVGAYLEANGA